MKQKVRINLHDIGSLLFKKYGLQMKLENYGPYQEIPDTIEVEGEVVGENAEAELRRECNNRGNKIVSLIYGLSEKEKEVKRLRKALKFYADRNKYHDPGTTDPGSIAREALK